MTRSRTRRTATVTDITPRIQPTPEPTPEPATVTEPCAVCGKNHKAGSAIAAKHAEAAAAAANVTTPATTEPATIPSITDTFTPEQAAAHVKALEGEAAALLPTIAANIDAFGMAMANLTPFTPWGDGTEQSARDYFEARGNKGSWSYDTDLRRRMIVAAYAYGNRPSMDTLRALTRASERTIKTDRAELHKQFPDLGFVNPNMQNGQNTGDGAGDGAGGGAGDGAGTANAFATLTALAALSDELIVSAIVSLGTERAIKISQMIGQAAIAPAPKAGKSRKSA